MHPNILPLWSLLMLYATAEHPPHHSLSAAGAGAAQLPRPRIIGGTRLTAASAAGDGDDDGGHLSYPFLAAFFFVDESRICSCALLTPRLAVTAAHCLGAEALAAAAATTAADGEQGMCKRVPGDIF